jgi:LPXTG-site transpeptidase (sortase) family protein
MAQRNPLFNDPDKKDDTKSPDYVLPPSRKKKIQPSGALRNRDAAANVIRQKLENIYAEEPGFKKELSELETAEKPLSKHQQYLRNLQHKATSVAEIQTKWHEYYTSLPEEEKQEVWREFYAEQAKHSRYAKFLEHQKKAESPKEESKSEKPEPIVSHHTEVATDTAARKRVRDSRSTHEVKKSLQRKLKASDHEKPHPLKSLLFGLSMGLLVLLIMLFGLFNQLIIAPFIQPSKNVSATPIILNGDSVAADGTSKVIIPKINVEIPVDYDVTSMAEKDIQKGLESGVVHYPTTVHPGEQGNAAFFGHSSNNIFNPGKYKFAFVLLSNLEPGDMFYLTYNKQVYAYKVYDKKIVNPDEVSILGSVSGKTATATLITCDPPGTTLHRLAVWGEQISPDPISNTQSTTTQVPASSAKSLTGAPPSLWHRLTGWIF